MTDARQAPDEKPRIWVLHCPFNKKGAPVTGSFGSTVRPVVIMSLATWQALCAEHPSLATTQFEVGTYE